MNMRFAHSKAECKTICYFNRVLRGLYRGCGWGSWPREELLAETEDYVVEENVDAAGLEDDTIYAPVV
jgi:hypothetical protein